MANVTIRRIEIVSAAKVQAVIAGAFGMIIGFLYGMVFIVIGATAKSSGMMGGSVIAGLAIMILAPVIYSVIGFIAGLISALIYNIAAGAIGGIQMELSDEQS